MYYVFIYYEFVEYNFRIQETLGGPDDFRLTPALLEQQLQQLRDEGARVGLVVLVNPHNPLGDVYSPHLVLDLLRVCARFGNILR
jgi:bifunctional pyridoxal-dependent enzyme with beta-cystathionase and maltose regulon repressor activities